MRHSLFGAVFTGQRLRMTALIIAVIALAALAAVLTTARRKRSSETERFHLASALTSGWAEQGEQQPVFDYPDADDATTGHDRGGSVELVGPDGYGDRAVSGRR